MTYKHTITALIGALMLTGSVAAQTPSYEFRGTMFSSDVMSVSDLAQLSQQQFNFGTARSMAMGGAFTSLGADLSSMSINPAGLGMYRRSEFSITPLVNITTAETPSALAPTASMPYTSNSRSRFGLGSFGAAFNLFESSSSRLLSLTLGVGYNRLADYNYEYSFEFAGGGNASSIADAMSVMLEAGGATVGDQGIAMGNAANYRIDPFFWPAVAGYKTYLVDRNANGVWYPAEIGDNARIGGGHSVESRGSAGEFDFSLGGNISNKLYFGATIGIQSIHQSKRIYYGEGYTYGGGNGYNSSEVAVDADGRQLDNVMQSMGMIESTEIDGAGVNFKVGLIYRPIEALRIGVAFHTPTFYSLSRNYRLSMSTRSLGPTNAEQGDWRPFENNSDTLSDMINDSDDSSWDFHSPSRLMLGASYTFGGVAILSVDYQRDWYNGIRVKNTPYIPYGQSESDYKQDFKSYFQGTNTVRAGFELRPFPTVALRAGFGYMGSMLKDGSTILTAPATNKVIYYTAGLGMQLGRKTTIDLAYCHSKSTTTDYLLYYGAKYTPDFDEIYSSDLYRTTLRRHSIALTLGVKF